MSRPAPLKALVSAFALLVSAAALAGEPRQESPDKNTKAARPSLSLKATPLMSFTPAKVRFTAELKGGDDDYEELYCASVEWVWDDGTTSESKADCEPYESGRSRITRRFTHEHVYHVAGIYRVTMRLLQKKKVVLAANTQVQVNQGIRDPDR